MTTERMSNIEIQGQLQQIGLCARILISIRTGDLLHEFSMNDTLGPLLDPTGWMAISKNARKNERVVRALADFQKVLREEWPEIEEAAT